MRSGLATPSEQQVLSSGTVAKEVQPTTGHETAMPSEPLYTSLNMVFHAYSILDSVMKQLSTSNKMLIRSLPKGHRKPAVSHDKTGFVLRKDFQPPADQWMSYISGTLRARTRSRLPGTRRRTYKERGNLSDECSHLVYLAKNAQEVAAVSIGSSLAKKAQLSGSTVSLTCSVDEIKAGMKEATNSMRNVRTVIELAQQKMEEIQDMLQRKHGTGYKSILEIRGRGS